MFHKLFPIALALFLLMDSIGNIPFYISFLKNVDPRRQSFVIFREMLIALGIIVLFNFVGDSLMIFLQISSDTIQIAGGIILFLLCLKMIFPPPHDPNEELPHDREPFIVPLAVPLVAGPAVLSATIIYSRQESPLIVVLAIFLAWGASLLVLLAAPPLKKILGWKGIVAIERLMGLILTLIAIQMFLNGIEAFINKWH